MQAENIIPFERVHPGFDRLVSPGQDVEQLGSGYTAAEGPVWFHDRDCLIFSDHRASNQYRWDAKTGVSRIRENTRGGNGQARDLKGRLLVCERIGRRLTRFSADGEMTVIANNHRGVRLNSPNDVVVKSDGAVYFTDPGAPGPEVELGHTGVYRLSPDCDALTLLLDDLVFPNGLAFSPDERIFYVIDTQRRHIRAFDMQPDGMLARGTDRVFFQFPQSQRPGLNDGMKIDTEGNVYCTGPGGVWVIDPNGVHLGIIVSGAAFHTNLAWGGADWTTLFMTTRETLCRIRLNIPGISTAYRP